MENVFCVIKGVQSLYDHSFWGGYSKINLALYLNFSNIMVGHLGTRPQINYAHY